MGRVFRFIKALFRYAIYGHFKNTTFSEYAERITVCSECEKLNKEKWTCGICGCYLTKKAKWQTEDCPLAKWKNIDE